MSEEFVLIDIYNSVYVQYMCMNSAYNSLHVLYFNVDLIEHASQCTPGCARSRIVMS